MNVELLNPSPATRANRAPNWLRSTWGWIDERLGINALTYPVPEHANRIAWTLGGTTAVSFGVLIASGILLAQFYAPVPELANQSVRQIETGIWAGSFIRGIHFWAAQAMYVGAFLHLVRVFLTGSFKKPREGNWLVGVAMFGLITLAIFTGSVLKWDQEGFEALGHNVELGQLLGNAGFWFAPTFADQISILLRLYGAHVVIIPGIILVLVILHFLLVKRHHMSPHPSLPVGEVIEQAAASEPTEPFTRHLRRLIALGIALAGIIGVLAVLLPASLGTSPVAGIEVTKPPWMFWWPFTLENWFGLAAIAWGLIVFFVLLALVPFLDRGPQRSWRQRPVALIVAAIVLAVLVALTILMAITPTQTHL